MLLKNRFTVEVPDEVEEVKIVFFTDTHFGEYYPQEKLTKLVEKINEEKPDFVIFGGDLIDNYARDQELLQLDKFSQTLAQIKATHGKITVYGNHDYGGGAERVYQNVMTEGGFTVLKNEELQFENLNLSIVGYDDSLLGTITRERYELEKESYHIVVTHEPDVAEDIKSDGSLLVLSGHSHGGQVTLPYLTKKVLPYGAQKYIKGQYDLSDVIKSESATMIVSRGIGMTIQPYRFLNPPEVVVVTLKRAPIKDS